MAFSVDSAGIRKPGPRCLAAQGSSSAGHMAVYRAGVPKSQSPRAILPAPSRLCGVLGSWKSEASISARRGRGLFLKARHQCQILPPSLLIRDLSPHPKHRWPREERHRRAGLGRGLGREGRERDGTPEEGFLSFPPQIRNYCSERRGRRGYDKEDGLDGRAQKDGVSSEE